MHTYIPEQTVTLAKYYRNLINKVNGIITKRFCVLKFRISCKSRQDIDSKKHAKMSTAPAKQH